mmetsp:Transcript_34284/g.85421  ORF Transcript_34284/g.85421 Transcript_34284/m.85421 type:complete len:204 (+) Transcript_34284:2255-2866(+)
MVSTNCASTFLPQCCRSAERSNRSTDVRASPYSSSSSLSPAATASASAAAAAAKCASAVGAARRAASAASSADAALAPSLANSSRRKTAAASSSKANTSIDTDCEPSCASLRVRRASCAAAADTCESATSCAYGAHASNAPLRTTATRDTSRRGSHCSWCVASSTAAPLSLTRWHMAFSQRCLPVCASTAANTSSRKKTSACE